MSPVPVQVQLRQVQLSAVRSLWQVRLVAGAAHCRCSSLCTAHCVQLRSTAAQTANHLLVHAEHLRRQ